MSSTQLAIKDKDGGVPGAPEVVVDALPYIDQGYDEPGVREAALAMVEEECRRYRPTRAYVETPGDATSPFETPAIKREMERVQNRLPMEPLSMKRYELPPPPSARLTEPSAWAEAVDNSLAQLQQQATRVGNLQLQLEYGSEAWKSYLGTLTALVQSSQAVYNQLRSEIANVNWERKRAQTSSGARLRTLRRRWAQLVSDNYRLERAIVQLQHSIDEARKQRDEGTPSAPRATDIAQALHSDTERQVHKRIEDMFAD